MIASRGLFLVLFLSFGCDTSMPASEPTSYSLDIPDAFPIMDIPSDNPLTVEGIALGRKLFFDPILSIDSTVACASCHSPATSFTDPLAFSKGVAGETGRNSMPIINVGWMESLFLGRPRHKLRRPGFTANSGRSRDGGDFGKRGFKIRTPSCVPFSF